jgi:hypothetical protein
MEEKIEKSLQQWLEQLRTDNPQGFIAMQIFEDEGVTCSINCSSYQLCIMLLILCQEHNEFKSAILGAANEIREWKGGNQ